MCFIHIFAQSCAAQRNGVDATFALRNKVMEVLSASSIILVDDIDVAQGGPHADDDA